MTRKINLINNIAIQAALIIIGMSVLSLLLSIYLYRESMREIVLNEVENKATIFLSAMENSVRQLMMERNTQSLLEMLRERAEFLQDNLNFAVVGVVVRDADGKIIEHIIKNPDGTVTEPLASGDHGNPEKNTDFQTVRETGQPLVKRKVKTLRMLDSQPEIRVIEVLYPIKKRKKGEVLAIIKLVISMELTFDLIREQYQDFTKQVVLGFALVACFLVLGIWFFLRFRLISPVLAVNEGARKVAAGDLTTRLDPRGTNEISTLMQSFNKMVDGLKQRDQMRRSLEVAKEVQQNLLPKKNPQVEGLDIAGRSIYCDETGGDYYDFIELDFSDDSRLAVVIGDVSGHGISSALLMASTRAFLHQRAALPGTAAAIVSDVNAQFSRDVAESGSFMSMFYLTIDTDEKCIRWVRAGHDPAVLYDPELDALYELKGPGIALGVDEDFQFEENSRWGLRAGQIILLGTDGIWEARNPSSEMFGKELMYALLREHKDKTAGQIVEEILRALNDFQQGAAVEDDVTLIVIKLIQGA
jgi:serine phosphatase RsbU (regulator of sigma subunit)